MTQNIHENMILCAVPYAWADEIQRDIENQGVDCHISRDRQEAVHLLRTCHFRGVITLPGWFAGTEEIKLLYSCPVLLLIDPDDSSAKGIFWFNDPHIERQDYCTVPLDRDCLLLLSRRIGLLPLD